MIDFTKITKDPEYDQDYYPFYYNGFRTEQSKCIFEALDKLAENCSPKNIIEIGCRNGGFTKILDDHPISENAIIHTFDIDPQIQNKEGIFSMLIAICVFILMIVGIVLKISGVLLLSWWGIILIPGLLIILFLTLGANRVL